MTSARPLAADLILAACSASSGEVMKTISCGAVFIIRNPGEALMESAVQLLDNRRRKRYVYRRAEQGWAQ